MVYAVLERTFLGRAHPGGPGGRPGKPADLEQLAFLCKLCAPGHTFCALAPGAAEPLQSALKYLPRSSRGMCAKSVVEVRMARGGPLHRGTSRLKCAPTRTCSKPASRWASICLTSAGIPLWGRWGRAASAR